MQEAVSLQRAASSPCGEKGDNMCFNLCSSKGRSGPHVNRLRMWFAPQLCEQTNNCSGQQLSCNNIVDGQHLLTPQVEHILATRSVHGRDVGLVILWSLWDSGLTTCDNLLWAIVKASISQPRPTTADDLKTTFWNGFNDLQS